MEVTEMQTLTIDVEDTSLSNAQERAREAAAQEADDLRLIAWYDQNRGTGGPTVACQGEVPKCVHDYAASHGGDRRVLVNEGHYEFYFSPTGEDVEELDEDWVGKVHEGLETGKHENVQGG